MAISVLNHPLVISIHALLAESDGAYRGARQSRRHFYPRSPCGERQCRKGSNDSRNGFLSTLSLRRATARRALGFVDPDISIHALLAESDHQQEWRADNAYISIHALLAESDTNVELHDWPPVRISIHALLAESDALAPEENPTQKRFLSTLSLRRATSQS